MQLPEIKIQTRLRDGETRLMAFTESAVGKPFVWNETNCAALALAAIDAVCGTELFDWQKTVQLDEKRALVLSKERATRSVLEHIGMRKVDPPYACRGDILLTIEDGMECAHVSLGLYSLSSSAEKGVHLVSTESVVLNASELEVFTCL
jgi:hypothetical protein